MYVAKMTCLCRVMLYSNCGPNFNCNTSRLSVILPSVHRHQYVRVTTLSGVGYSERYKLNTLPDSVVTSLFHDPCSRSVISPYSIWRHGIVVSWVRHMNEVNAHRAWLVLGWASSGGYTIWVFNKPTRSTQPCIPPGSLNQVPASAGVKLGMSPLSGGR